MIAKGTRRLCATQQITLGNRARNQLAETLLETSRELRALLTQQPIQFGYRLAPELTSCIDTLSRVLGRLQVHAGLL